MSLPLPVLEAGYRRVLRPAMFASFGGDPERIHEEMIRTLATVGSHPAARGLIRLLAGSQGRAVQVAGIDFPNRVGLAAGLDKDASAVLAWAGLGFGFAELGTVTGRAQPGNERPRVFRLRASHALINRMGFNNPGADAVAATLAARNVYRGNGAAGLPIGISIGKTKLVDLDQAIEDYLISLRALAVHADYVAVNVSSPNTPGLRSLQDAGALSELVAALVAETAADARPLPIFVKVAPDLSWAQLDEVVEVCRRHGAAGLIATNTTVARDGLAAQDRSLAELSGGLSGAPLTRRAREVVGYLCAKSDLPVIGVGGIMTADDATAMFDAGAALIQLYSGFIYGGPGLVAAINAMDKEQA
jgi:dihydroorotate dehydrogenase, subfamily 2